MYFLGLAFRCKPRQNLVPSHQYDEPVRLIRKHAGDDIYRISNLGHKPERKTLVSVANMHETARTQLW